MALWILLYHSIIHLHCDYGLLNVVLINQTIPMTLFFMLSGYSLQMTYGSKFREKSTSVKKFYAKRLAAIWPLYMVCTILTIIIYVGAGQQSLLDNLILMPLEMMGLQSLFPGSLFQYSSNSGTWFISCLFVCYAMFPVLAKVVNYSNRRKVAFLTFFILLWVYFIFIEGKFDVQFMYTNPLKRLLEFLIGMALANVLIIRSIKVKRYHKPLVYVSNMSFALYLGQGFVILPLKYCIKYNIIPVNLSNELLILLLVVAAYIVAIVLHEVVEKPSKHLLSKYMSNVRNR